MRELTLFFIGRSGCGKGTQAALLRKSLEAEGSLPCLYIETGALFRGFVTGDSWSQQKARAINSAGGFQPEFMPITMWANFLLENVKGPAHMVFDGTPRKRLEAMVVDGAMDFYDRQKPIVIWLDAPHTVVADRLRKRGRIDDSEEGIASRLALFEKDVVPSLDYFTEHPRYDVIKINGDQTIEAVHADIMKALSI